MILVDVNLLIYAVNQDLPHHPAARTWWESHLSSGEPVGIPWVVILAFLRITTHPRLFARPLPIEQAIAYVNEWLAQPAVTAVAPGANHWDTLRALLAKTGTQGNLTTDAHIAALALDHACAVYTADNDFQRFPGIQSVNPLAA